MHNSGLPSINPGIRDRNLRSNSALCAISKSAWEIILRTTSQAITLPVQRPDVIDVSRETAGGIGIAGSAVLGAMVAAASLLR